MKKIFDFKKKIGFKMFKLEGKMFQLKKLNQPIDFKKYFLGIIQSSETRQKLFSGIALGIISLVITLMATNLLGGASDWNEFMATGSFFAPILLIHFWGLYAKEKKLRKINELLPDVLFQASLFPAGTGMEEILRFIADAHYPFISIEFNQVLNEIQKGSTVGKAFQRLMDRNPSAEMKRVVTVLLEGYESGAEMRDVLQELGEDLLETQQLMKERQAAMFIEKYTLIFAGGLLVPLVLGLIVQMVQKLDFSQMSLIELGGNFANRSLLLQNALMGNEIYIIEYALLASLFVALQEGQWKKTIVYALFLVPMAFTAYHLPGWIKLF